MNPLERKGIRRRTLFKGGLAAAAVLAVGPRVATATERACCPIQVAAMAAAPPAQSIADLTLGNQQAMALAQRSQRVMEVKELITAMAEALPDPRLRAATLEILRNPAPLYQLKSPTRADKEDVRQELLAAGLHVGEQRYPIDPMSEPAFPTATSRARRSSPISAVSDANGSPPGRTEQRLPWLASF